MESAPSQTSSGLCSFCGQQDNQAHQCRSEAFKLLNILAQDNQANPFSQVENLVFQGGGVKGIAYVGVLRKLFDEYKVHEQVKRVAGSSAGSIAALYICLGLSIETIEEYMNADMLEKLESEPQITVDGKSYAIRDVFDKVLDFSGNYTQDDLAKLLKDVITNLLKESLSWLQGILASKFASGTIANAIASFFAPSDTNKKTIRQRLNDLQDEIKKEEAKYNPEQAQQDQAKENVLKGIFFSAMDDKTAFHKALSQLLQQTFLAENPQFPDGWFPGDKVKEDLIKKPIEEGYKSKGLPVPDVDTLTFEDFANARVGDKPAFKKLYVTGFNTITQRTEVFSADHTPNVLVVDAVRASMSIPAFFKSVPIREKNVHTETYPVRKMYISEDKWAVTRYMDGGILDNYPIWIFDDLQYCLGDNTAMAKTWRPKQKIGIRNPFTLGIKLIDCSQRQQFLNPYIDETRLRLRALELPNKVSVAGLLAVYFTASSEDNMHIQRGDTSRTIYVDNLGVTAISFKLSVPEKIDMQKAGELAVKQYVNYAKWGKLSEIGENYYPIQRPTTVAE